MSKRKRWAGIIIAAILCGCLIPAGISWAASFATDYSWYTDNPDATEFTVSTAGQLQAFAELVNGTADTDGDGDHDSDDLQAQTFAGKNVNLGGNVNFLGNAVTPIGGQNGTQFCGTFDGNGYTINNYVINGSTGTANIGFFGACGRDSFITDVTVGSSAKLQLDVPATGAPVKNAGLLVGYSAGSITDCTNSGTVSITSAVNQTTDEPFVLQNVGGMAGQVIHDITNCTNRGKVTVQLNGVPDLVNLDQTEIANNVGGIVGCAGDMDSSIDPDSARVHGAISNCTNVGDIVVNSPADAGLDRFFQQAYTLTVCVGGIAGYSRGDISDCSNTAYISGDHPTTVGGIVGSLRAPVDTFHFSQAGSDDGSEEEVITVARCVNTGDLEAWVSVGGIAGRAGTYTVVTASRNGTAGVLNGGNTIVGKRWNKPFIGGINGGTYGVISYCSNYGRVATATSFNRETGELELGGGYYAAGISGDAFHYTDTSGHATSPMPEIYGCYSVGPVLANGNFRQRALVGDNSDGSANIHNNVAIEDCVTTDELLYMGEGYVGGSDESNAEAAKTYNFFVTERQLLGLDYLDNGMSVIGVLNASAFGDGWVHYWVKSDGTTNRGYPVIEWQQSWEATSLADATVTLADNAQYCGLASAPWATVTLDGVTLEQNVDFKVIPTSEEFIDITEEGQTPYTATIEGIGNYTGMATALLQYGMGRGDLANCSVTVGLVDYNAAAQDIAPDLVTVRNMAGGVMDPSEYTVAVDPECKILTDGHPVQAGRYNVIVTAKEDSVHFVGSNSNGVYTISQVPIGWSDAHTGNWGYPEGVTFTGGTSAWQDTAEATSLGLTDDDLLHIEYTGHPIYPTVDAVYLQGATVDGKVLMIEGTDWRTIYGASNEDEEGVSGVVVDNTGEAGGTGYGFIMVRGAAGSNYTNLTNMKFIIEDTAAKNDLALATVRGTGDVAFEPGSTYEPVTLWYSGSQLTEGVDYDIVYEDNDRLGTASFTATACADSANFEGSISGTFNIVGGQVTEFTFTYDEDTLEATVTGVNYLGSNELFDLVIPATTERDGVTYTVTAIGPKAFGGTAATDFEGSDTNLSKLKIRSVVIPPTVRTIGAGAFALPGTSYEPHLTSVVFDDAENSQLETIDEYAFQYASALTEFTFPPKVDTIGKYAFRCGTSAGTYSGIHRLVFLTEDPTLPSNISNTLTFTGVGWDGKKVAVYGYDCATAVKDFAVANGKSSQGTHRGKNFEYHELASIDEAQVASIDDQVYTGKPIEPDVVVSLGGTTLVPGQDYTVLYSDNAAKGTATVRIVGAGRYGGEVKTTFQIVAPDMTLLQAAVDDLADEIASVSVSEDGSDVETGETWVTPEAFAAATRALDAGRAVLDDEYATASDVSEAVTMLLQAATAFLDAEHTVLPTLNVYAGVEPDYRFDTARRANMELAATLAAEGNPAEGVIVVAGQGSKFPDALSAAGLSGISGYPVVMVSGQALTDSDRATLAAFSDAADGDLEVLILGDENSVSAAAQAEIEAAYGTVTEGGRIAGADRYLTNQAVYAYGAQRWGWNEDYAFVARGDNFPDALSIAPFLAANGCPLLLVDPKVTTLTDAQTAMVSGAGEVVALGDDNSVPAALYAAAGCDERLYGRGTTFRYGTSAAVAAWETSPERGECALGFEGAGIATGTKFPDALGSASLLGHDRAVLLLANPAETAEGGNFPMRETLATAGRVSMLRVFGGPDAQTVPETVYAQAAAAVGWGDNYKPVEK